MDKVNVEKIKSEISITSLADSLRLRRSGQLYYCISANHRDSTPSLSINEAGNYFHCFGCGIGGSVIDLYMILYGMSFIEASRRLAKEHNISVDTAPLRKVSEETHTILTKGSNFLCKHDHYSFDERAGISSSESLALQCVRQERLKANKVILEELYQYCSQSGMSEDVYSYLTKNRKLSEEIIRKSRIFSIQNYQNTNEYLKSIFDIEDLRGSGLFKYNNLIFRNTHRLIIPYIENEQIIYLRARYFDSEGHTMNEKLKYFGLRNDDLKLNTVKRFYNTDILSELKIYDELFICEGELDCLALLTIGLNAVAVPGVSAVPLDEINRLTDYDLVLCFDNDPNNTGQKATERLIETFRSIGKHVNYIELPEGVKDVSDFITQGYSLEK